MFFTSFKTKSHVKLSFSIIVIRLIALYYILIQAIDLFLFILPKKVLIKLKHWKFIKNLIHKFKV